MSTSRPWQSKTAVVAGVLFALWAAVPAGVRGLTQASPHVPITVAYQPGVNGYNGLRDTFIAFRWPDKNFCQRRALLAQDYPRGRATGFQTLIAFSRLRLPAHAVITRAILRLYAFAVSDPNQKGKVALSVCGLLRPFSASTATWKDAAAGTPWDLPGAMGVSLVGRFDAGYDRALPDSRTAIDVADFPKRGRWVDFNVTRSMQAQRAAGKHYGWVVGGVAMATPSYASVRFRSGRGGVVTAPRLSVTYVVGHGGLAAAPAGPALAAPRKGETLTGDTSHPHTSTFSLGQRVILTFRAAGLKPFQRTSLLLDYWDAHNRVIRKQDVRVTANAQGVWSGRVVAPCSRYGFYRVWTRLADGTTLPRLASRPPGFLTYAVVPNPGRRKDYGEAGSMFGMQCGFGGKAAAAVILPYLGVRWILGGKWSSMEPDGPGQLTERMAGAAANGKEYQPWPRPRIVFGGKRWRTGTIACLNGTPKWATKSGRLRNNGRLNRVGRAGWQEYCREVAKFFPQEFPHEPEHLYQLTWEPDYPWGFKGTSAQLMRIYQLAYPIFHKFDPHALVLGPTCSVAPGALQIGALKAGLGRYIDGFDIHDYCQALPLARYARRLRQLKALLHRYAGHDIPIYGTEQGFATGGDVAQELPQALADVRENLVSLGEGLRLNFAFYAADFGNKASGYGNSAYGYYYNLNPRVRFGSNILSPKPVVPAYAAMTYLIDGHRPSQRITWLGPTVLGYAFQRGSDIVLALWNDGKTSAKVSIPTGVTAVKVYGWMGNRRTVRTGANQQITLTLGRAPTYIRGVSPAIWGRGAARPLSLRRTFHEALPGQTVVLRAAVAGGAGRAGPGWLRLTLVGNGVASVAVSKAIELGRVPVVAPLTLTLPQDIPVGRYTARLTLSQRKTVVAATGIGLKVISPVAVTSARPVYKQGQPFIMVALKNRTARRIRTRLQVRLAGRPDLIRPDDLSLAPGALRRVYFNASLPRPADNRLYSCQVGATDGQGYRTTRVFNVSFNPVPRAPKPPALRAALNHWAAGPVVALAGRGMVVRSPQYYNGRVKAKARFAWDAANFYIAFDVTDPVFIQKYTGFNTWRDDCLQLEFNLDPGRKRTHTGNELADRASIRHTEIDVALTRRGPQAYRTVTYDAAQLPVGLLSPARCGLAVWRTAKGLDYRIAIPWKQLGAVHAPSAGRAIGFAAYVNDVNSPTQPDPSALGLYVRDASKNLNQFGTLVLIGRQK